MLAVHPCSLKWSQGKLSGKKGVHMRVEGAAIMFEFAIILQDTLCLVVGDGSLESAQVPPLHRFLSFPLCPGA